MLSIKQRLLAVIEQAPDPLLEETLTFLEFLMTRTERSVPLDEEFDLTSDSKGQILADLKTSLQQSKAGKRSRSQNFGMALMSDIVVELQFTALFKRRLRGLAKRYRQIQTDIQPVLEQISLGNFIGDRIAGTNYTVYKVRAKNSDAQVGKSGGYRLIYQIELPTCAILHLIYAKSDQATVNTDEVQEMVEDFIENRLSKAALTLISRDRLVQILQQIDLALTQLVRAGHSIEPE